MKLHEDQKLFEQAVRSAAERMGILPIYIEKDYWVCYALKNIFKSEAGQYTVFKGGTALSKCFALIDRFSEDIDLVAMKSTDESGNQLKEKLRKISKSVGEELREVEVKGFSKFVSSPMNTLKLLREILGKCEISLFWSVVG